MKNNNEKQFLVDLIKKFEDDLNYYKGNDECSLMESEKLYEKIEIVENIVKKLEDKIDYGESS